MAEMKERKKKERKKERERGRKVGRKEGRRKESNSRCWQGYGDSGSVT